MYESLLVTVRFQILMMQKSESLMSFANILAVVYYRNVQVHLISATLLHQQHTKVSGVLGEVSSFIGKALGPESKARFWEREIAILMKRR